MLHQTSLCCSSVDAYAKGRRRKEKEHDSPEKLDGRPKSMGWPKRNL